MHDFTFPPTEHKGSNFSTLNHTIVFCFSFTKKELQIDNFVLSAKPLKSQTGINRNKYRPFKNYQKGENSYSICLSCSNSHPGQKSFP